ncbi:hypothetical protein FXO38_17525 [Capsicum annuum]|nr:hypothetical protein FXO38_17525 [Capsicum annuum]
MHPYLNHSIREIEHRYMKIFKPYIDKVKDTSIDALKVQLKSVIVLTSSVEVADEEEDLGSHNYVPSIAHACDHDGSRGLKTTPDFSNDDDLCECVAVLEKSVLAIAFFVRDERLRRIEKNKKKHQDEVVVIDIAAADEKAKEEKKEDETKKKKAADEKDVKRKKKKMRRRGQLKNKQKMRIK